jgi:hypothetical protein
MHVSGRKLRRFAGYACLKLTHTPSSETSGVENLGIRGKPKYQNCQWERGVTLRFSA